MLRALNGAQTGHCNKARIGLRKPDKDNRINRYLLFVLALWITILRFLNRIGWLRPRDWFLDWLRRWLVVLFARSAASQFLTPMVELFTLNAISGMSDVLNHLIIH